MTRNENKKTDWKKYLFELIVIITGISISFMVQNWRENQKNLETEQRVLHLILEDLSADSTAITNEIQLLEKTIKGQKRLLTFTDFESIADSVNTFLMMGTLNYSYVKKESIGYQALLQYEVLKNMANQDLARDILHLYSSTYPTLNEWEEIDKTLVMDQQIPYIRSKLSLTSPSITKSTINNEETKNIIAFSFNIKSQVFNLLNEALAETTSLHNSISKELEQQ